jgi:UDP-3-O-[3-hydroxymyristoyl] glucosamine N-acyltransferase
MTCSIAYLARLLGLPFQGDGNRQLAKVSSWQEADCLSLVFIENPGKSPIPPFGQRAGCILAPQALLSPEWHAIISERPKLDFARAAALVAPRQSGEGNRDSSASIASTAEIGPQVDIGPFVTVGSRVVVGRGSILHAGVVIGAGSVLGERCILYPGVILYPETTLGNGVILHAGAVLGGDGFGYVSDGQSHIKFPQVGRVVIEDDVEIGANTTIDRGSLGTTRIGAGTKIDNLVQIAHNVQIGRGVIIAAQTGISGSTVIEDEAIIGGQVGFGDHARVEKGVVIGSKAGVLPGKIVRKGEVYWGVPIRPLSQYKRLNALFGRLPEMKAEIDALKNAVKDLQDALAKVKSKK